MPKKRLPGMDCSKAVIWPLEESCAATRFMPEEQIRFPDDKGEGSTPEKGKGQWRRKIGPFCLLAAPAYGLYGSGNASKAFDEEI